jgi:hypothetical protein
MSAELLRAARAEEQRLLRELESTPLFRRLEAVRSLLAEYGLGATAATKSHAETNVEPAKPRYRRAGSLTHQVIAATSEYLREQQRRAPSTEILQALRERGIEVTGQKPNAVVASILSHSELFKNVRGEGYGLTEWGSGLPLLDPDRPAGGGEEEPGAGDAPNEQPDHESGLDSRAGLVSNTSWAANVDRSRPNSVHDL